MSKHQRPAELMDRAKRGRLAHAEVARDACVRAAMRKPLKSDHYLQLNADSLLEARVFTS